MIRSGIAACLGIGQRKVARSWCRLFPCHARRMKSATPFLCREITTAQSSDHRLWKCQKNVRYTNEEHEEGSQDIKRNIRVGLLLSVLGTFFGITKLKEFRVNAAKPFGVMEFPEDSDEGTMKKESYDGIYEKNLLMATLQEMANDIAELKIQLKSTNSNPRDRYNFFSDAVEQVFPSVVSIAVQDYHWQDWGLHQAEGGSGSTGSGFVVSADGRILTNAHVVASNRSKSIQVTLNDGRILPAVVEDIDYAKDLAVIKISCNGLKPIEFGNSSEAKAGEFVAALGSPLALKNSVTVGVVSSKARDARSLGIEANEINYIQTDAAINYGNSGGPLINLNAEVIGVNSMKLASGISFAIPIEYAKVFLEESFSRQKYGKNLPLRPYMGLTVLTLTDQLRGELKERTGVSCSEFGVLVWQVVVGSPAYRAGIQPGDVITEVNGDAIKTASGLYESAKLQTTLKFHVQRGEKLYVCTVNPEYLSDM